MYFYFVFVCFVCVFLCFCVVCFSNTEKSNLAENAEPNDNLLELAARYRTEILSDLTARYRQSIGEEEGTIRIGGMYCLLMAVKVSLFFENGRNPKNNEQRIRGLVSEDDFKKNFL